MSESDTTTTKPLDAVAYNDPDRADWRATVDLRLNDGAATMKQLRADLQANTDTTHEARDAATEARVAAKEAKASIAEIKSDTSELIELVKSFQGAMRVLNMLGKLAKPLTYIIMLGSALWGVFSIVKGGGEPPR